MALNIDRARKEFSVTGDAADRPYIARIKGPHRKWILDREWIGRKEFVGHGLITNIVAFDALRPHEYLEARDSSGITYWQVMSGLGPVPSFVEVPRLVVEIALGIRQAPGQPVPPTSPRRPRVQTQQTPPGPAPSPRVIIPNLCDDCGEWHYPGCGEQQAPQRPRSWVALAGKPLPNGIVAGARIVAVAMAPLSVLALAAGKSAGTAPPTLRLAPVADVDRKRVDILSTVDGHVLYRTVASCRRRAAWHLAELAATTTFARANALAVMLAAERAVLLAAELGELNSDDERQWARYEKIKSRAIHPSTPTQEAETSTRLALKTICAIAKLSNPLAPDGDEETNRS
jgi:hypothetical protein